MSSIEKNENLEKIENVENKEINEQTSDTKPVELANEQDQPQSENFESNYASPVCPCTTPYYATTY